MNSSASYIQPSQDQSGATEVARAFVEEPQQSQRKIKRSCRDIKPFDPFEGLDQDLLGFNPNALFQTVTY